MGWRGDVAGVGSARGPVRRAAVRLVAYGLPVLVALVGVTDADLWPATGWRLFSGVREGTQPTWILDVTTSGGEVRRHQPSALGPERRSWRHLLDRAIDDPVRREQLCGEWLTEAIELDGAVTALSIRRAVIEIPRRAGQPAPVVSEREVTTCHR